MAALVVFLLPALFLPPAAMPQRLLIEEPSLQHTDLQKNVLQKTDLQKNVLQKNDLQKNDLQERGLQNNDLQNNENGLRSSSQPVLLTVLPVPIPTVAAGRQTTVELSFRVAPGYHVNSATPNSRLLIPTTLSLALPAHWKLEKVEYPPGENFSLPFDPSEKLNVYTGEFTVRAKIRSPRGQPAAKYRIGGQLRYQACNDNSCFPPKQIPLEFEVRVNKAKR